jgi:hypothetical protein
MTRRRTAASTGDSFDVDEALAAMNAGELRALVRDLLLEIHDRQHEGVLDLVVERAARSASGWAPDGPSADSIPCIVNFAKAAVRVGYAEPSEVDEKLRQGVNAFLSKNYTSALEVFRALLPPIGEGDIYLGQHEMLDEVLSIDVAACAAMYVVAMYMSADPTQRAQSVWAAIDDVCGVVDFWEPLREMERTAVEPLPRFDDFLKRWRAVIQENRGERESEWDSDEDRWLREVIERMEGAEGLAKLARATRRADDLRAWCHMLVAARDWKAALAAHEEAADIIDDKSYSRGAFLDGAALAARELGRRDLPARLERAWREAPSMLRLCRWLGAAKGKAVVRERAARALKECPRRSVRQLGLLYVVLGDPSSAAKLLSRAPGLGWSDTEHPGHLLFPLFQRLLGGADAETSSELDLMSLRDMNTDELEWMADGREEPRLDAPEIDEIVQLAGTGLISNDRGRAAVLRAMRKAAEKRVAGVIENQRRRFYGHAAQLVATCAALDLSSETTDWVIDIREKYRRYPAFQRELAAVCGITPQD